MVYKFKKKVAFFYLKTEISFLVSKINNSRRVFRLEISKIDKRKIKFDANILMLIG